MSADLQSRPGVSTPAPLQVRCSTAGQALQPALLGICAIPACDLWALWGSRCCLSCPAASCLSSHQAIYGRCCVSACVRTEPQADSGVRDTQPKPEETWLCSCTGTWQASRVLRARWLGPFSIRRTDSLLLTHSLEVSRSGSPVRPKRTPSGLLRGGRIPRGLAGSVGGLIQDSHSILQPRCEQANSKYIGAVAEGLLGLLQDVCRIHALRTSPGTDVPVEVPV